MAKILAGPFLRHVNADQVNIFLALDAMPQDAKAVVYDEGGNVAGQSGDWRQSIFRVAPNLYTLLFRVAPDNGSFATEQTYTYNISLDGADLHALGILSGDLPLGYMENQLPGFYLPAFHRKTLSASCRKPHASIGGEPVPDQLVEIDRVLGSKIGHPERPTRLVLTGDQIYADDVAPPLLALCELNAETLMGKREHVLLSKNNRTPFKPAEQKLDERDRFLTNSIGFTSGAKSSHLVTYGEYLAMYLLVWGGDVNRRIPEFDEVKHRLKNGEREVSTAKANWREQARIIQQFLEGSRRVARLMANIPTYMIFDDHDVTDDWNLTRKNFRQFTSESILAKNVLVNALSAYTVFQHWGNSPSQDTSAVLAEIQRVYGGLGFDLWQKLEGFYTKPGRLYFGYAVESAPPMVVLDTRTHRSFKSGLALMDTGAFAKLERQLESIDSRNGPLLLISPTPVFGYNKIEALQMFASSKFACTIDKEPWIANQQALKRLRGILARFEFRDIYTLSGDVHYSFARWQSQVEVGNRRQNWWQLTTSPSCNVPVGGKLFYCFSDNLGRDDCWNRASTHYLKPDERDERDIVIQGHCNYGLLELNTDGGTFTVYRAMEGGQKPLTYRLSEQTDAAVEAVELAEPA